MITLGSFLTVSSVLLAADSTPKAEITSAAQQLAAQDNYSWRATTVVPEGTRFRPGPIDGKTQKEGFTHIKWSISDNEVEIVQHAGKAAFLNQDGLWQLADDSAADGPGRWMSMFARNMPIPAKQVIELVGDTRELAKDGEVYSGELTEDGAKALLSFRRGGEGPSVSNARGSVKFWIKEGTLTQYEYKVQGQMDWNGNDVDIDRNTTVEIKDVGSTKVEVAEKAKVILGS